MTRTELIETMARAICGSQMQNHWTLWKREVEAALSAIHQAGMAVVDQEPTSAALNAGDSCIPQFMPDDLTGSRLMGFDGLAKAWPAMVAAADLAAPKDR